MGWMNFVLQDPVHAQRDEWHRSGVKDGGEEGEREEKDRLRETIWRYLKECQRLFDKHSR